jgi:hypothetical protein
MTCPRCGAAAVPGAPFCPRCGARLLPEPPSSAGRATVALPGLDPTEPDEPAWRGHLPARPPLIIPAEQSTLAAVSLVCGILAWTVLPLLGAVAAVVTGHLARSEIRRSEGRLGGWGLATAGLALGYAWLALGLLGCCALGLLISAVAVVR